MRYVEFCTFIIASFADAFRPFLCYYLHVGGFFSGFFDGGVAVVSLLLHASGSLQMRLALLGL